ncbi:MAG: FGGY family carbohydrate kinase [Microthrixaceae bacterium]
MPNLRCVLGIDIGTSGARALVVDSDGGVRGEAFVAPPAPRASGPGREQDARLWWDSVESLAGNSGPHSDERTTARTPRRRSKRSPSTRRRGTIVPRPRPTRPGRTWGLMYNDGRATHEASVLNTPRRRGSGRARRSTPRRGGEILWLQWSREDDAARARRYLHQADYVNARLLDARVPGDVATDESNALKTGYDPASRAWSPALAAVGIAADLLPQVVPTGSTLGVVGPEAAAATGLPPGCRIVAGMTDCTAAAVASGATAFGDGTRSIGAATDAAL